MIRPGTPDNPKIDTSQRKWHFARWPAPPPSRSVQPVVGALIGHHQIGAVGQRFGRVRSSEEGQLQRRVHRTGPEVIGRVLNCQCETRADQ